MKFIKLLFALFIVVSLSACGLTQTGPWVTSPIKTVSIAEDAPKAIPDPVTVTQIKEAIMFDYDSSLIKDSEVSKIDKIGSMLNEFYDTTIVLKGYASSEGEDDYNSELSIARAESVKAALMDRGITRDRILVLGEGETKLFGDLLNLNRRVVVLDFK